jgi:hypothetical protein
VDPNSFGLPKTGALLIFFVAGLILHHTPVYSANILPDRVQQLADRLGVADAAQPGTTIYSLTVDADFPCAVTLNETRHTDAADWQRRYRFDLTDMKTGVLLRAQDSRRAITYDSVKTGSSGERRVYPSKQINFIGLQITDPGGEIQSLYDAAVEACREKNEL